MKDNEKQSLRNALMIGDMESDQQCANNARVRYLDVNEFIRLNLK